MGQWKREQFEEAYDEMTSQIIVKAEFRTQLVGGQPASADGIEAFVTHHLGLTGKAAEDAAKRILKHEVGTRENNAELDEVPEEEVYGVNVLRRDEDGRAWLGDWQIKACIKCATSRLGFFQKKRGTKGDIAELSQVRGYGPSKGSYSHQILICNGSGEPYTGKQYERFLGSVNTPSGRKSIVHHSEVAPVGCSFSFEWRLPPNKLTEDNIVDILAAMQQVGLGSCRSMERGKLIINEATINLHNKAKDA